ncbi:hypothetical protein SBRY_140034 [Actinacidiphila bryophytorum]|uniref:Uncharacterized protein n=1 Tax=Actinacidiphila bryophytorum TaxID=1436133 RepID=A0A9W4GZW7_9ACTN|nr:hypothetical protein SBRY_140034 [Actinacidiphila bryophytorum]
MDPRGGAVRGRDRLRRRRRTAPAVWGGPCRAAGLRGRGGQRADRRADEVGRQHLLRRRLRRLPGGLADVRLRGVRGDRGLPAGERAAGRVDRGLAAGADPRRRHRQSAAGRPGLRRAHPHRLVDPAGAGRCRTDHPGHLPAVPGAADRGARQLSRGGRRPQGSGDADRVSRAARPGAG